MIDKNDNSETLEQASKSAWKELMRILRNMSNPSNALPDPQKLHELLNGFIKSTSEFMTCCTETGRKPEHSKSLTHFGSRFSVFCRGSQ